MIPIRFFHGMPGRHCADWLSEFSRKLANLSLGGRTRRRRIKPNLAAAIIELLEPKRLLTAAPIGFETRVNTYTPGSDGGAVVAMDATGDYVVEWTSSGNGQNGNVAGVFAQRYNASGIALGTAFQVNTYTTGVSVGGKVAMDAVGDFVVTWANSTEDGDGFGVYAQRYNSAGIALGANFRVNTYTTGGELLPAVAMDTVGDFVVTWTSDQEDGSGYGIYAQRYNSAGVAQGTQFRVNTYTTGDETQPAIAMDSQGDFVITWTSDVQDGSGYGVYAQRYSSLGAAVGSEFRVNTYTTNQQSTPSVSMDSLGDFVIVWQSYHEDGDNYGIYGQRFNSSGTTIGTEFQINTYTTNAQQFPTVAMDSSGDFAVVWESATQDGSGYGIYGQRFNNDGTVDGSEFRVNTTTSSNQISPAIATDGSGDFVVTWQSSNQDGSPSNIYSQRYKPATAGPIVTAVLDGPRVINPNDRLSEPVTNLTVDFSDVMSTVGLSAGLHSVTNPSNWELLRNGVVLHNAIQFVTFVENPVTNRNEADLTFFQPLDDGLYQLTAYPTIQNTAGLLLDGDDNGVTGGNFQLSFFVAQTVPVGSQIQVNTDADKDSHPALATDALGDFVIVWQSQGQDGSGYGIYGQRYSAAGLAQGSEFLVNTYTTGNQRFPCVAMDAVGDFVVSWTSLGQDGSGEGVYAQRYNASGLAQGSEFRVNNYTTGNQGIPAVAMDQAGDFVITWSSLGEDGSDYGVYARSYNASGVAEGNEFRVNTYTTGNQFVSSVAMDTAGDFVITWESYGEDSSTSLGVYAQRYSSFGTTIGAEFQVNTFTTGDQETPSVAMDAAGDFVITWQSANQDGSGYGIYAQRYNDEGIAEGTEFRVNQYTTADQERPSISMDANGDFTIFWSSDGQNPPDLGPYCQSFDAAGQSKSSNEILVSPVVGLLAESIAMDSAGDFIVAMSGTTVSSLQIYAQRYQTDVSPLLYGAELTPLVAPATLSTPIAPTLLAYDEDNNDWSGATVQISGNYLNGQDVLGFVNEFGITGAWNAATGTLTLSGLSTVSNYRSALRSVTYQNTSATPNTTLTRIVTYTVNDGLLNSDPVTRDLDVATTSVPAVLSGVSGTGTYSEDDPPIAVAANLVISDPDAVDLASATVSFTNWQGEDRVDFNNIFALQHTLTQNLTTHTASLVITGLDTVDHYQTLLRSVEYWDVSDNAVTSNRVATFTVTDGLSTSNAVMRNIAVATVNHPPVLSGIETTPLAYMANDPALPPQPISASLLVGDPDSNNCTKAIVQITSGYENDANGKDVLSFVNQLGITGSWNATTGTLTLTGTSSDSNYRTALRSVTFSTSGSNVSTANRILTMTATDDFVPTPATSLPTSRTITVSTTDIPPGLSGIPVAALNYARGTTAVAVAPAVYVTDPDSINMAQAVIQITGNYQNGQDVLGFTSDFGVTGAFNTTAGALTLTGITSLANYQTLLRSVTYKTNTSGASTSTRTISFTINDGLASSNAVTRNITLT